MKKNTVAISLILVLSLYVFIPFGEDIIIEEIDEIIVDIDIQKETIMRNEETINTIQNINTDGTEPYKELDTESNTIQVIKNEATYFSAEYEDTFESEWVSDNNSLNEDKLRDVTATHFSFDIHLDLLLNKSVYSEKSQENKMKYENLLYNQPEFNNNNILINRLECGEKICMASVSFDNQDSITKYLSNIQSVHNDDSIQTLSYSMDEDLKIASIIFSAQPNVKMLQVN